MSNTKYALRADYFGYNDEYYYFINMNDQWGKICAVYNDKDAAIEAWKALEYERAKILPMSAVESFIELPDNDLSEIDDYVFGITGEHVMERYDGPVSSRTYVMPGCEDIVLRMSVDQVFEFLRLAGLQSYTLVEFDQNDQLYLAWLPESQDYYYTDFYDYYSYGPMLVYGVSADDLLMYCEGCFKKVHGPLETISHSPEILRTLIDNEANILYDEENQVLSMRHSDWKAFTQLYPLLAQPPFEIRAVSLDEFNEIQQRGPIHPP